MQVEIEESQAIALFCVLDDFGHNQKGMIVIYNTKPFTTLREVLPLWDVKTLNVYDHYKYNGIPIISMRISQVEYDHYLKIKNYQ